MDDTNITLAIPKDHALVLFEWLAREEEKGRFHYEDDAEEKAVWRLEASLEKALSEPLAPNYRRLLEAARERIRGE